MNEVRSSSFYKVAESNKYIPFDHIRLRIMSSASVSTNGDEVVVKANIQDALILASAGLSVVKSLLSIGTYSCWHVLFSLMELVCSGLALALFVTQDYLNADGSMVYGDDGLIFLLAFSSSCICEVIDVVVTFCTVRSYKKFKEDVYDGIETYQIMKQIKRVAKRQYIFGLVFALVLGAIVPIVAFSKADWQTQYFAPSDFSPENGKFLLIAMSISIAGQGLLAFAVLCTMCDATTMIVAMICCNIFVSLLTLPASVLLYIVLARVERGQEAGSLTYLIMINVFQAVEMAGEISRLIEWVKAENKMFPFQQETEPGDDEEQAESNKV